MMTDAIGLVQNMVLKPSNVVGLWATGRVGETHTTLRFHIDK